jgi:hypothetical protein
MGTPSLFIRIRLFIGMIGWKLFIWGNMTTERNYWDDVYELEKSVREKKYHEED